MDEKLPTFMTIRQVARTGLLSEHYLRLMEKRGELPGFYTGRTYRVNVNMLSEKLNAASVERSL